MKLSNKYLILILILSIISVLTLDLTNHRTKVKNHLKRLRSLSRGDVALEIPEFLASKSYDNFQEKVKDLETAVSTVYFKNQKALTDAYSDKLYLKFTSNTEEGRIEEVVKAKIELLKIAKRFCRGDLTLFDKNIETELDKNQFTVTNCDPKNLVFSEGDDEIKIFTGPNLARFQKLDYTSINFDFNNFELASYFTRLLNYIEILRIKTYTKQLFIKLEKEATNETFISNDLQKASALVGGFFTKVGSEYKPFCSGMLKPGQFAMNSSFRILTAKHCFDDLTESQTFYFKLSSIYDKGMFVDTIKNQVKDVHNGNNEEKAIRNEQKEEQDAKDKPDPRFHAITGFFTNQCKLKTPLSKIGLQRQNSYICQSDYGEVQISAAPIWEQLHPTLKSIKQNGEPMLGIKPLDGLKAAADSKKEGNKTIVHFINGLFIFENKYSTVLLPEIKLEKRARHNLEVLNKSLKAKRDELQDLESKNLQELYEEKRKSPYKKFIEILDTKNKKQMKLAKQARNARIEAINNVIYSIKYTKETLVKQIKNIEQDWINVAAEDKKHIKDKQKNRLKDLSKKEDELVKANEALEKEKEINPEEDKKVINLINVVDKLQIEVNDLLYTKEVIEKRKHQIIELIAVQGVSGAAILKCEFEGNRIGCDLIGSLFGHSHNRDIQANRKVINLMPENYEDYTLN